MPTNIDKAMYQQPTGIAAAAQSEEPMEIVIVDPEAVSINGVELDIEAEDEGDGTFSDNLADEMSAKLLTEIAGELTEAIENDRNSRKEWEKTYVEGLKLLGLQYEERTDPWAGACGVFHPMITEAVVRFQSEAIMETFPARGPVRTKIIGKETQEKKAAAKRVEDDLNNELTEVMREFRPEHERMLWSLPAAGSAFKKVYYDPSLGRQVSMFVPAEDILLPYGTTELDTCYRVTHVMRKTPNEIKKLQKAGFYSSATLPDVSDSTDEIQQAKDKETGFSDINDERHVLYECHVDLDIEGYEDEDEDGEPTGIALPYVVTMIKGASTVLSVRRNWQEDDDKKIKRQHFVHYQYIPGFGAYGFGLFHLIGGFAKSATSIMRQLVDAGTLSNLPGGLKSRGLRIKGDDTPIAPGEFRDVDIGSGALRDNILPLPYKEPSGVLFQLLGTIVEEGRRFAATADMKVSDMSAQAPVGTTLALLERQLKVMSAVQARMHYSFKQELKLLAGLIRDYTEDDYEYDPETSARSAKQTDYDSVDIIPVSDPNAATMSQRVVQYQAVIQMAQMAPDIYDLPQLHRQMLEVLGVKQAEKLVPLPEDERPKDPVSENMAVLKGEPVKVFRSQDHQAHLQTHQSFIQDPTLAQMIGQNPRAPQMMGAIQAHIAEHVAYAYQQQMENSLGFPMPGEEDKLQPQEERQIAAMQAQAGQQMLQRSMQAQAQQQAQQQAQDPVVQMQQREMAVAEKELQLKEQKMQMDAEMGRNKLKLDSDIATAKAGIEERKLALDAQQQEVANSLARSKLAVDAEDKMDKRALATKQYDGADSLARNKLAVDAEDKMGKRLLTAYPTGAPNK
jgi:hypothetical protein